MIYQNVISYIVSTIKTSIIRKKTTITIKKTKLILNILKTLYKKGFIRNYYTQNNKIIILLKYKKNLPVIQDIKQISNVNQIKYIKQKNINTLFKNTAEFLISTTEGILTKNECLEKKIGGKILIKIN